jgi:hypothetical protein
MGKYVRLLAVLVAVGIATAPHLSESLAKFESPWVKALAAAIAVISTTFLNAMKVPVFSKLIAVFLKDGAGVEAIKDILPEDSKKVETKPEEKSTSEVKGS